MNNALEIGKTFGGGRYVVEKVIGVGGFGITYYVRHVELIVHYAVKEFFINGKCVRENDRSTVCLQGIDPSKYGKYKKHFADEARTLVVLNNPHVVRVIDIFDENNTSYIVMEYVPGITLQQRIEKEGKMPISDAVNCMGQLAEAVSYIHQKHILHRDIKPDNVIITPDNRVVLIDFGSAREFVHDEVQNQTAIVTHGYAPPEQYSTTSKKGNYTDIYALGGVFYFLLTGVKPVDATSRMTEKLKEPRELNPEIPKTISKTVMRAMAIKPEDRYQDVKGFMVDLLGEDAVLGKIDDKSGVKDKTSKTIISIIAVVVALLVVLALWFFVFDKGAEDESRVSSEEFMPSVDTTQTIVSLFRLSTGVEFQYDGDLDSLGVPNGIGRAVFDDFVYDGYFVDGEMVGYGELRYVKGSREGRLYKAVFDHNRIVDTCVVISGMYEFHGTLKDDMDYGDGVMINNSTGEETRYENGIPKIDM